MITGILFLENGEIQQIGELKTLTQIIESMQNILPNMIQQEKQRVLQSFTPEDLQAYLKDKE